MPKIIFGRDNRVIGGQFGSAEQYTDYEEIDIDDIYLESENYNLSPFDPQEEWYVAGLKYPRLVSINRDVNYNDKDWKATYEQEYGIRKNRRYKMFAKSRLDKY